MKNSTHICPVEKAGALDNNLRKLVHNPVKILRKYVKKDMSALDFGCGPGFFSMGLALIVGNSGKVIAADLQEGMLNKVKKKINKNGFSDIIQIHKCEEKKIGIKEKLDFTLAFYVVHEVPNQKELFDEVYSILNPGGGFLVVEPKFHVNRKQMEYYKILALESGFKLVEEPRIFFSRSLFFVKS